VLLGIVGVNLAIYLLFRAGEGAKLGQWLERHFGCSIAGVFTQRRYYTLLTSTFSHRGFFHLAFNMIALTSIAPQVLFVMGDRNFLCFYLGSGIISSFFGQISLLLGPSKLREFKRFIPSYGASGAVIAVFAFSALLNPDSQFILMFLPLWPLDAITLLKSLVIFDSMGLLVSAIFRMSPLGHGAHLTGVLCGYLMFQKSMNIDFIQRRVAHQRALRIERRDRYLREIRARRERRDD